MEYDLGERIDRSGTGAMKTSIACDGSPLPPGALSMWIADMDIACAPPIVEAVKRAAERRIFGYTVLDKGYVEALRGFYARRHGVELREDELVFSCGVVSALDAAVKALTSPGDGVIIQQPVYAPFARVVGENSRRLIVNPLLRSGGGAWSMDLADLEQKASDPGARLMLLCSPHNPVGRVWSADELSEVYRVCSRRGITLVCDEIHCDDIRKDKTFASMLRLFPGAPELVVCSAPSKSFNIAGLGVSHSACADPVKRGRLSAALGDPIINPLSIAAARAAYSECDGWLDGLNAYVDGCFERLSAALSERLPGARLAPREGTYLAFVDMSAYRPDSLAFERELIERSGLALEAGARFGEGGEGFMRMCVACPADDIDEAISRMKRTVRA